MSTRWLGWTVVAMAALGAQACGSGGDGESLGDAPEMLAPDGPLAPTIGANGQTTTHESAETDAAWAPSPRGGSTTGHVSGRRSDDA